MAQQNHFSRFYEAFGVPLEREAFDIQIDGTTAVKVRRSADSQLEMILIGEKEALFDPALLHFSQDKGVLFSVEGSGFFATLTWDMMAKSLAESFPDESLSAVCHMLAAVDHGYGLHERYPVLPVA